MRSYVGSRVPLLHETTVINTLIAHPSARSALREWIHDSGTLVDAAARHPAAETLRGRGRVYVVPAPGPDEHDERWVVRHYLRGGAVASLLGDRYFRFGTPRPFRELRTGRRLEELEVPTVLHLGAAIYPSGPWYRGDLVTRYVPDSRDLAAVLFPGGSLEGGKEPRPAHSASEPAPDAEAAMQAAGSLVRLLHDRGVVHRDLNLKNILITGSESGDGGVRALVLDLDRASVRERVDERARRRMLDRFWRSARKWETATGRPLAVRLRAAFEAGYGSSIIT